MTINLRETVKWLGWGLFIALLLSLKVCQKNNKSMTIPEIKGKFEAVKPKNEPIGNSEQFKKSNFGKNLSKKEIDFAQSEINRLLQENENLINHFSKLPDTIKITEYAKVIELNKFSQTYDDSLVNIKTFGIARGTVEKLGFEYIIKKQKVTIPDKNRIGIYLGSEIGTNKDLNQFTYKANLGVQNKKGNIYRVSYQRIANDNYGLIGVDFRLF